MATSVQEFLQANPGYRGSANTSNRSQPKKKESNKQRGRGGFLTSLISELGGAGGAATGAAVGSLLGPLGTVVGAGVGGLVGGTGGRVAENKVRDNEYRLGDALKEGALSGAFGAAGAGFQALKGARAAKALGGALGDDAASKTAGVALKNTGRQGIASRKGLDIVSKSGGYYARENVPGIGKIGTQKVQYYDDLLKKLKIPANDAGDVARQAGQRLSAVNQTIEQALEAGNKKLTQKQVAAYADDIFKNLSSKGGVTQESKKFALDQLDLLKKNVRDTKGLHTFRKQLDEAINWNANPDSATAQLQNSAKEIRKGLKNILDNEVPGLRQSNKLYHDLTDIEKLALKSAGRVSGEATQGGGGLASRLLSSPTANTARAKAGRALTNVGPYTAGTGGFASQVTNQALRQAPGNIGEALATPAQDASEAPQDLSSALGTDPMGADLMGGDPMMGGFDSMAQPQYTLQQALQEAYSLLGDRQSPATYLQYAKAIMDANEGSKASANQKNASAKAEGANRIIDELEAVFNQSGGARGPIEGRVGQLGAALGGGNQALKSYQDLRSAYTAQISRALGEVGVLTDKDREVIQRAIPSVNDSREAASIKLNTLRNILAQLVQNNSGAQDSNDLINALSQQTNQGIY